MLRPEVFPRDNALTRFIAGFYVFDTNTNVFPSVHVLGVLAALFAIWHTPGMKKWTWRVFSLIYGILIIASTLFVKQHAFIDVLAGLFLGTIGYVVVYVIIGRRRDRLIAARNSVMKKG